MRTPAELEEMAADGRIYFPPKGGTPGWKRYANELKGQPVDSIWDDIPALTSFSKSAKEALGYPTQKPLALLDRIIKIASSKRAATKMTSFSTRSAAAEPRLSLRRN